MCTYIHVSLIIPLSIDICQEYEVELETLQEQKKTYEVKMKEYEALQQQKKVMNDFSFFLSGISFIDIGVLHSLE